MPHLMNCQHSDSGWCLDCVKNLQQERDAIEAKLLGQPVIASWWDRIDQGIRARCDELMDEVKNLKELRKGDNTLILALAESVGIKIDCNPEMMGLVWEQFHEGVMNLYRIKNDQPPNQDTSLHTP